MIIRRKYRQKTDQRYSFWILLCIFLMRIELCLTSTSSFLGMDATTLRSLGISESEIESILAEEEDYKGAENDKVGRNRNKKEKEDDYLQYESATTLEEEEDVVESGSESAWWKDPLARFGDEDIDDEYEDEATEDVDSMSEEIDQPLETPTLPEEKDDSVDTEIEDDEEEEDSQEGLSLEAKERLAKNSIVMAEDYPPQQKPKQNRMQQQEKKQHPRTTTLPSSKKSTSKLVAAPALPIIFLNRQAPALKMFMGVAMVQFFLNLFFGKAKDLPPSQDIDNDILQSDDDAEDEKQLKPKEKSINMTPFLQNPLKSIFRKKKMQNFQEEMSKREANLENEIQNWKNKALTYETEIENISQSQSKTQSNYDKLQQKQNQLMSIIRNLKRELSTMEDRIDDAVQSERNKANDELRNVREAMMKILVKERKLMKMEMKKNNDRVRALLLSKQQEQHGVLRQRDDDEY